MHIIELMVNNIDDGKDLSYIFLNIVMGVGAIKGLGYLKTFKDKRNAAVFTYWIQLRVRMMEIKSWLENDNNLINYLFNDETRKNWEDESADFEARIKIFKGIIEETSQFVKKTPDQIPAYVGWTDDYNKFTSFLCDVIQFDICNGGDYYKYEGIKSIRDRNDYCKNVCIVINRMCKGIEDKQIKIENELQDYI